MQSKLSAGLAAALVLAGCATNAPVAVPQDSPDPYLWLEDVTGERALSWVRERNAASQAVLTQQPEFGPIKTRLLEVLRSRDRIPYVKRIGAHVYNFWTDEANKRGIWRRTTLADYKSAQPKWETVLDIDALGRAEKESWVWAGSTCLHASTEAQEDRCMIGLSRGGSDAAVYREFDLTRKAFVTDGFVIPEAKTQFDWAGRDTMYVATDFGPGSLTKSGYARIFKRWQRGTPLAAAPTIFEVPEDFVYTAVSVDPSPGFDRHVFYRARDFFHLEPYLLQGGKPVRIPVPDDAGLHFQRDVLVLALRSPYSKDGVTYPAGAVIATDFDALMAGRARFEALFSPTPTRSLARSGVQFTRTQVLLSVTDNVIGGLEEFRREGDRWVRRVVPVPGAGQVSTLPLQDSALAQDPLGESYFIQYTDYLTPDSLFLARSGDDARELLKRRPSFFDASGMRVEQLFATSRDGTRVPYFVVWPRGAKADGTNPTLLYGYGGFQVSTLPTYKSGAGDAWLARGGVYVDANLRGGGEFGPAWHQAAMLENKQRSYDDFIAIAEDLIARKITSPAKLGILGGSNGGLLVGAAVTQRPDLFGAAVCLVPLLDMRRYSKLLAGASWMAEYGDPDDAKQWAFISRYSPYHQVRAGARYPRVFFATSTRDDRVHPGHARKMVARMQEQGHEVLYYENIEGGHGAAADADQAAHLQALEFSYLWMQLGPPRRSP